MKCPNQLSFKLYTRERQCRTPKTWLATFFGSGICFQIISTKGMDTCPTQTNSRIQPIVFFIQATLVIAFNFWYRHWNR
ncbi:hypothetical protein M6B38_177145 [Iris pallida]|uniref:Uncharacterized protein n=1 Tax=Iris pallida TaxID=29817 RepID=A0AAX6EPK9_IRIPA|nr:hypothetical protein M6B38_177145 [Iris pallida]